MRQQLSTTVDSIFSKFPTSADAWQVAAATDDFPRFLRGLGADNLGSAGSRMLLHRMGIDAAEPAFCKRALYYIDQYCLEEKKARDDPDRFKFGGPILHKRVFAYCEYRLARVAAGRSPTEGAIFQENSARRARMGEAPRWISPIQLPINEIVDRSMCTEFLLLTEFFLILRQKGVMPGMGTDAVAIELRLYASGPPCVSCLSVIRQVQLLFPGIRMVVSFGQSQVVR